MAMIAKILPLPIQVKQGEMSIQNSLAERGYYRHPGTSAGFPPIRGMNGKYLTGLDEDADYINQMINKEEKEVEKKLVKERRLRLEKATGINLGPTSEYYSGTYGPKYGTMYVAKKAKLTDGENVFNFSNPYEEIAYYWIIQNKALIAPSLEQWKKGQCKSTVQFYVQDPEAEAKITYNENKALGTAVKKLEELSLPKRKKVARLIGLPIGEDDKEEIVYNQLYKFINTGEIKGGEYHGRRSVQVFNEITNINDSLLEVKALVKDALRLRVWNKQNNVIYEGMNSIYESEADAVMELVSDKHQVERLALESKVNDKIKLKSLS